jgi:hypothetical protein
MNTKLVKMFAISLGLYACEDQKVSVSDKLVNIASADPSVVAEACKAKCKYTYESCLERNIASDNTQSGSLCSIKYGSFADEHDCVVYERINWWDEDKSGCSRYNKGTCLNNCYERQQQIIQYQVSVGTYKEPTTTAQ